MVKTQCCHLGYPDTLNFAWGVLSKQSFNIRRKNKGDFLIVVPLSFQINKLLLTFTVITPFLPTFFMAEEINSPTPLSPLAEIVATCKQIILSHEN